MSGSDIQRLDIASGVVAQFATSTLLFVGNIIFARILGPGDFGSFYILLAIVQVIIQPFLGVAEACKKRYSEPGSPKQEIVSIAYITFTVSVITSIIVLAGFGEELKLYTGVSDAPALFLLLSFSIGIFTFSITMVESTGNIGRAFKLSFFRASMSLPIQYILITNGYGVAGYAIGLAVASIIITPFAMKGVSTRTTIPRSATIKNVYKFARYSIFSHSIARLYDRIDILLLGILATQVSSGYYESAYKLTVPGLFVAQVATESILVKISGSKNSTENVRDINEITALSTVLPVAIFFGSLSISGPLIEVVYGADYQGAGIFLIGISAYRILEAKTMTLHGCLEGLDLPNYSAYLILISTVVNIIVGVYLITKVGAIGIIMSTIMAKLIDTILSSFLINSEFKQRIGGYKSIFHQFVSGIVMFIFLELTSQFYQLTPFLIISMIIYGGIIYISVLYIIDPKFKSSFWDYIPLW